MLVSFDQQTVLETIAEALERLAFLTVERAPRDRPAPPDIVFVRVPLRIPTVAAVEMLAPRSLGALIAANAMALAPGETISPDQACDALAEFLNILASALLSDSAASSAGQIIKGVPQVVAPVSSRVWDRFVAHDRTVLFMTDGNLAACRLLMGGK